MAISPNDLQSVTDRQELFQFLNHRLDWPVETDEPEPFTYPGPELHSNLTGKVEVRQIVPFGGHDPYLILLAEFSDGLRRTDLREILRSVRREVRKKGSFGQAGTEDIVFVCAANQYNSFHFARFQEQDGRQPKLSVFGWQRGAENETRTARDINLPCLRMPTKTAQGEYDWNQARWADAWNVERVTKDFFHEYAEVFDRVESLVTGVKGDKRLFVQRLFNRLMFIQFLSKKGWLRFNGRTDYLNALWDGRDQKSKFYRAHLVPLFFAGLNNPQARDLNRSNPVLQSRIGDIPFLNGGLFEQAPDEGQGEDVPDEAISVIVNDLFTRWNFTITESTPLDVEVAVDPEMLGKVFEELVNERHKTGSYYTPRSIVAFMCREALKGYLGGHERLIDERDTDDLSRAQAAELLHKLQVVRVVDPACGSGAYLLGMLHELFELTALLEVRAEPLTPTDAYRRKLKIIQSNLYGVDLDDFAVNIARLRFWLSLVVEYDGDNPQPLPNLDFKLECGDSLAAPDPSGGVQLDMFREAQIAAFDELKANYADPYWVGDKRSLKAEIAEACKEIAECMHPNVTVANEVFDWRVQFAEVFRDGGFDIVLANPPYGEGAVTDSLRDALFGPKSGQIKDIYAAFMARGLQLTRPGGMMSYITSNTWRTIRTHRPLRRMLLKRAIYHTVDVPEWVFDAPVVRTCVVTLRNTQPGEGHRLVAADLMALPVGDWATLDANLIAVASHGPDLQTLTFARYTYPQAMIGDDPNVAIFIARPSLQRFFTDQTLPRLGEGPNAIATVAQGLATGDNGYYVRIVGKGTGMYSPVDPEYVLSEVELAAFAAESAEQRLIGISATAFGGRTFVPFDKGADSDLGDGGWLPCFSVPATYYIDWSQEAVSRLRSATIAECKERRGEQKKIKPGDENKKAAVIRSPELYFRPGLTFSRAGRYAPTWRLMSPSVFSHTSNGVILPSEYRYSVLGACNSKLMWLLAKAFVNNAWDVETDDAKRLPIPTSVLKDDRLTTLVEQIVEHQQKEPRYDYWRHEGSEIEEAVAECYGLTPEEVRDVDLWMCRYERGRLAAARGWVEEAKAKYADHLEWCDHVLAKPPGYWRSHPVLKLIARGEGDHLEFKETLAVDNKTGAPHAGVVVSALKTIAAFLNTSGGTLLIGVSDAGGVKGLDPDFKQCNQKNPDGFEQKIRSLLRDRFDPPAPGVKVHFETLAEGMICRVEVERSEKVVHLDNAVYVRDGNVTIKLEGRTLTDWIQARNAGA